jgi:hypothetical protein
LNLIKAIDALDQRIRVGLEVLNKLGQDAEEFVKLMLYNSLDDQGPVLSEEEKGTAFAAGLILLAIVCFENLATVVCWGQTVD